MDAQKASLVEIEPGGGRCVLVVTAHADDAALFLGGTIAGWTEAGWRVVVVRVTDDRWDSVDLDEDATITANAREFLEAMQVLGVAETIDLGYPTDTLGDLSEVELREHMIRLVRTHTPYALVTFDPYAMFGEDNQDHVRVAAAVDESFWTSQFDKHHPEHLADGRGPHGVFERWYFGRRVVEVTDVVDISSTLDRKVAAAQCHRTPMRNFANQLRLQARTGGWDVPMIDEARASGDVSALIEMFVLGASSATGERHQLAAAEEFRVVRFGGLEAVLRAFGTRRRRP